MSNSLKSMKKRIKNQRDKELLGAMQAKIAVIMTLNEAWYGPIPADVIATVNDALRQGYQAGKSHPQLLQLVRDTVAELKALAAEIDEQA